MPDSQPRRIAIDGQPNFRDLGGYRSPTGQRVAHGRIYRSGELSALTDSDLRVLERLKIRTVVDLRTLEEIATDGEDRVPDGVRMIHIPIDTMSTFRSTMGDDIANNATDAYHATYRAIVDRWSHCLAELIGHIEDESQQPLVFHCSHGKDRAGMAAAAVLAALSVDWDEIEHDYLYSNVCRAEDNDSAIEKLRSSISQGSAKELGDIDEEWIRRLYYVEPSYLAAARQRIDECHGGIDGYLRQGLGLSDARLGRLRAGLMIGHADG